MRPYPSDAEVMWEFHTPRFAVIATVEPDSEPYDGDDAEEVNERIASGLYACFNTRVSVWFKPADSDENGRDWVHLGDDSLGGSVYERVSEFFDAHRDPHAMNRNCEAMRAAKSSNVVICHYFPSMVAGACKAARAKVAQLEMTGLRDHEAARRAHNAANQLQHFRG